MSPKGGFEIGLCSDEDIPQAFLATSKGFGHDAPFWDAYFPHHDTAAGQAKGAKRLLQMKNSEEESYFVKAFVPAADDTLEQIIGFALWTHMMEAPSGKLEEVEDVQDVWRDEEDREYMKRLWKDYVVPRGNVVKESGGAGVFVLEILAVDREYQRKGAGTALVLWGTSKADQKGLESVVEGTPEGLRCYHQGGFRTEIEEMKFDAGERFADRKRLYLTFLRRKAEIREV